MANVTVEATTGIAVARRRFEHVERKGLGHPDSMCDAIAEAISTGLCRAYREACGRVMHHNADKALLAAGRATPRPGGGTIDAPMRLVVGDRAASEVGGKAIPVTEIAEAAAREWCRRNLRFVDAERHLVVQNEMRPGSAELTELFARAIPTANDTSIGVGYAPLTETERLVLEAERLLNSSELKKRFPEVGEDVKVMAVRHERDVALTIAAAFVDRFVPDPRTYFSRKAELAEHVQGRLRAMLREAESLGVTINVLDDPARGAGGMYLTVTGVSAEGADSGQVGRGNRCNGLITPHRPMSLEAVAGKNPVSHVGKIYNVLADQTARRIVANVEGVEEATVWLCSQIGRPIDDPWSAAIEIVPRADAHLAELQPGVREIMHDELRRLPELLERLTLGQISVC